MMSRSFNSGSEGLGKKHYKDGGEQSEEMSGQHSQHIEWQDQGVSGQPSQHRGRQDQGMDGQPSQHRGRQDQGMGGQPYQHRGWQDQGMHRQPYQHRGRQDHGMHWQPSQHRGWQDQGMMGGQPSQHRGWQYQGMGGQPSQHRGRQDQSVSGQKSNRNPGGFNHGPVFYQDYNNSGNNIWPRKRKENEDLVFLSKTLSSILRHNAERFGLKLMKGGFLYVDDILRKVHKLRGYTDKDIRYVVENNDKKRFTLETEADGRLKIRANQGHTLEVDELELRPIISAEEFPKVVHGTYYAAWELIKQTGLCRMKRNHIHFAAGEPGQDAVISDGLKFLVSSNNVILCAGNDEGYVFPCYFQGAVDRRKGHRLEFDASISCLQPAARAGEPASQSAGKKSKKNKKKRKAAGRDSSSDRQAGVGQDKESSSQEAEASCTGACEMWVGGAMEEKQEQSSAPDATPQPAGLQDKAEPPQKKGSVRWDEAVMICDADQSRSAVAHMLQEPAQTAVVVCCYGHAMGTPDSHITHLLILAQPHMYMYQLKDDNQHIINDGGLKDLLLSRDVKKVFHTIGSVAASLIYEFDILLNGVPITDIAVLYGKVTLPQLELEEMEEKVGVASSQMDKLLNSWPIENEQLAGTDSDAAHNTLINRGKLIWHLHQICSKVISVDVERKVKKEVYELAVPTQSPALADKVQQLKTAAKAAKAVNKHAGPAAHTPDGTGQTEAPTTATHQQGSKQKKGKKKNK